MAFSDSIRTSNANFSGVANLIDSVHTENYDGWTALSETFTYASSSTITVATGAAARFRIGDKLLFTNSTVKYMYITAVADTLLTVTGGSDYSVANAAITNIYQSRADWPSGFPAYHNYSPSLGGFSVNPTNAIYSFFIRHGYCFVSCRQGTAGTSNATSFTISAPIAAKTITNGEWGALTYLSVDNGSTLSAPSVISIGSGSSSISLGKAMGSANWTNANGKKADFTNFSYPII